MKSKYARFGTTLIKIITNLWIVAKLTVMREPLFLLFLDFSVPNLHLCKIGFLQDLCKSAGESYSEIMQKELLPLIMEEFDVDQNGKLNWNEFSKALQSLWSS
eukprot:TRINITY_DN7420_c0_g2_i2.p1 TRINITY_DN7420_c0_g2~~TRINITY_DN7420_c0_g2_i2.p1  ORF type:complete len:103 (-),score=7.60 TRINITY_DN7420_c0_g2_i2:165-473(-)